MKMMKMFSEMNLLRYTVTCMITFITFNTA